MTIDDLKYLIEEETEYYIINIEECLYESEVFSQYYGFVGAMFAFKSIGKYFLGPYFGEVYMMEVESYKKVNRCILENFGQEAFNYCVRGRK